MPWARSRTVLAVVRCRSIILCRSSTAASTASHVEAYKTDTLATSEVFSAQSFGRRSGRWPRRAASVVLRCARWSGRAGSSNPLRQDHGKGNGTREEGGANGDDTRDPDERGWIVEYGSGLLVVNNDGSAQHRIVDQIAWSQTLSRARE